MFYCDKNCRFFENKIIIKMIKSQILNIIQEKILKKIFFFHVSNHILVSVILFLMENFLIASVINHKNIDKVNINFFNYFNSIILR